jgi:hypothetical protein
MKIPLRRKAAGDWTRQVAVNAELPSGHQNVDRNRVGAFTQATPPRAPR